jgi:hypothetical protein
MQPTCGAQCNAVDAEQRAEFRRAIALPMQDFVAVLAIAPCRICTSFTTLTCTSPTFTSPATTVPTQQHQGYTTTSSTASTATRWCARNAGIPHAANTQAITLAYTCSDAYFWRLLYSKHTVKTSASYC